jgi:hypothetical protein
VTTLRGGGGPPRFVVMRTTPLALREPYIARSVADLSTSMRAMSFGFTSMTPPLPCTIGWPSSTNSGSEFPLIVFVPRTRMTTPPDCW